FGSAGAEAAESGGESGQDYRRAGELRETSERSGERFPIERRQPRSSGHDSDSGTVSEGEQLAGGAGRGDRAVAPGAPQRSRSGTGGSDRQTRQQRAP